MSKKPTAKKSSAKKANAEKSAAKKPTSNLSQELDKLLNPQDADPNSLLPAGARTSGWNPGVKSVYGPDGIESGTIVTDAMVAERDVSWDDILLRWNLDPEKFEVVPPVYTNTWPAQTPNGETVDMVQYKGKVQPRTVQSAAAVDAEAIAKELKRGRRKKKAAPQGSGSFCVSISDTQIGKGEGGGTAAIIERFSHVLDSTEDRIKELRKLGRPLDELVIFMPGDTVEGCGNQHYAMQTYQNDADNRQQMKIARELIKAAILRWSPYFPRTRVAAVAGNHGERRQGGKAYTNFSDNADLEVVETLQEAFALADYQDVEFILGFNNDPLCAILDIQGWRWGLIHGHVARGGSNPEQKVVNWFAKQAMGKLPIGQVDAILTGHYHHFRAAELGGVFFMQSPSLDGGSTWFTQTSGMWSEPGVLTWAIYPDSRTPADLEVLRVPEHLRAVQPLRGANTVSANAGCSY